MHSQAKCAFNAVVKCLPDVHNAHMTEAGNKEDFLREWRLHCGFTLEAAAEAAGMSHSQLSRIERGGSDWTRTTLHKLAEIYLCEAWELLHVNPNETAAQTDEISTLWVSVPREKRPQARQILETFADKKKA